MKAETIPIMKLIPIAILVASALPFSARAQNNISDAQIAAIVVTANQVDIDAGKFASQHSTNQEVKQFAQMMVTDHTAVNKSAMELATKLKVMPEENDTSRALKSGGLQNVEALDKLSGPALDKAYVDHEVAYHEQVIQAIDTVLIPNAQPAFIAHLNHAKHLQATFK